MILRWEDSIHTYDPDETGKCQGGWMNGRRWISCGSKQRSSVLHDDPAADFREMHWHGGGDCMCFENENGPSYHEAEQNYIKRYSGYVEGDNGL